MAAAWVLLYHLQGPLDRVGLLDIPVLPDVLNVGRLGVDLFFALSGFILTHTYLTRLGPRLSGRKTIDFWWLRLARVYPVHLVMLVVAGLAVFLQAKVTGEALNRDWLNPIDFGKNRRIKNGWTRKWATYQLRRQTGNQRFDAAGHSQNHLQRIAIGRQSLQLAMACK